MNRELGVALLLCLAGGVLLLVGAGATWSALELSSPEPLPATTVRVSGADLVPGLRALGLLGLAGVAALLAARRGRVAVGALLAVAGGAAAVLTARVLASPGRSVLDSPALRPSAGRGSGEFFLDVVPNPTVGAPAWFTLLGGVLLLLAGLLTTLRGRRWPALGARYEAPGEAARPAPAPAPADGGGDKQAWEALDRGEDPTA